MNEVAVEPHVLYHWATGPVDAVADDLKSAYSSLNGNCEADGLTAAKSAALTASTLCAMTEADGAWGQDERFVRGRIYDFAGALLGCGRDYEATDVANADHLSPFFNADYGNGVEPSELGDSAPYRD